MTDNWIKESDNVNFPPLTQQHPLTGMVVDSVNAVLDQNNLIGLTDIDISWAKIRNNSPYTIELRILMLRQTRERFESPLKSETKDFETRETTKTFQLLKPGEVAVIRVVPRTGWVHLRTHVGADWFRETAYTGSFRISGYGSTISEEKGWGETIRDWFDQLGIPWWLIVVAIIVVVVLFIVIKQK